MSPRSRTQPPSTTRRPAPTTERGADRREAILQAALELFVERGFHGTAVPEVAERAAVGAGTIYRYFASKEALVNELYRRHKSLLTARILHDFPLDAPAREQYGTLWRRLVRYVREEPLGFAFLELHNHASYLDADSRALEERITTFGIEFIRGAQGRGELRAAPPLLLVGIVMGAFIGLVRKSAECDLVLDDAAWATAEQCVWEAIRV
ncbi:MAG: TetR/AcrR family transcriptional regulator [Kofleriaceae bacterium]|nr:TetR/AcrR family transcriptional regulator [Kofleriaceae bacterium]MCL4223435.1 TetR family transcriptional regulator [Myxococcales bacterium]